MFVELRLEKTQDELKKKKEVKFSNVHECLNKSVIFRMRDGHYFCGLQIDYQETVIHSVHVGFTEKNHERIMRVYERKKLRESDKVQKRGA